MAEVTSQASGYNNCFVLGGKCRDKSGETRKSAVYIKKSGIPAKLYRDEDGKMDWLYNLFYQRAARMLQNYHDHGVPSDEITDLRVSLYLDNAMYNDLHIFVIDFDAFDEQSPFFLAARALANKVTRSQGGGYHMFYGIDKATAAPLFDSINLLASRRAASFVCYTRQARSLDGKNKVDFFCDTRRLIYEWEDWDNTVGLTDCTEALYLLIKEHFSLNRPTDFAAGGAVDADGNPIRPQVRVLEQMNEPELLERMSDAQKKIFENLKTISSDCDQAKWFSVGLDIWHVFGGELGGNVFRFWSAPGHSFQPRSCENTWGDICLRAPHTKLFRPGWRDLLQEEALLRQMSNAQKTIFEELKTNLPDCETKAHFSMGLNIWHVFGSELGGEVFRFWSRKGQNFDWHRCDYKWRKICARGPESNLSKHAWRSLLAQEARQAP